MAHNELGDTTSNVWLMDSEDSNHMSGMKELSPPLDETKRMTSYYTSLGDSVQMV